MERREFLRSLGLGALVAPVAAKVALEAAKSSPAIALPETIVTHTANGRLALVRTWNEAIQGATLIPEEAAREYARTTGSNVDAVMLREMRREWA